MKYEDAKRAIDALMETQLFIPKSENDKNLAIQILMDLEMESED